MKCHFCGCEDTKVIDSRPVDERKRRRRECISCGKRFTTYESVESPTLFVLKKDGTAELFDRQKLIRGLSQAVKKRPIGIDSLNTIADNVENYYQSQVQTQITTSEIGDIVLAALKDIDLVAYVRFASIYKEFESVDVFLDFISELKKQSN